MKDEQETIVIDFVLRINELESTSEFYDSLKKLAFEPEHIWLERIESAFKKG